MEQIAFVTGADRGVGYGLCLGLLERGWRVFAGQYMPDWTELTELAERSNKPGDERLTLIPLDVGSQASVEAAAAAVAAVVDHVDLLINNAGIISKSADIKIGEGLAYDEIDSVINVNTKGPLRVTDIFLPLVQRGALQRLCYISSEAGSISESTRKGWYGYCMSKSALNMGVKIMFNHLRPEGYSFRLYHPGSVRSYMHGVKNSEALMEPEESAAAALAFFLDPTSAATRHQRYDEDTLAMHDREGRAWPW